MGNEPDSSSTPPKAANGGSKSAADEVLPRTAEGPKKVPILALRNTVLFPRALLPVSVGRSKNVRLIQDAMSQERVVAVFMQRDASTEDPTKDDLHSHGTLASIARMVRVNDETIHLLLQGIDRVQLESIDQEDPYLSGTVVPIEEERADDIESEALGKTALDQLERLLTLMPEVPRDLVQVAQNLSESSQLSDFLASLVEIEAEERQKLLAESNPKARLKVLVPALERQLHVLAVGKQIQDEVKQSIDERQREAILRAQMEAIQRQLGEDDEGTRELEELQEKLDAAELPEEARKEVDRDLSRLRRTPTQSGEYSMIRTYLEWVAELPWNVSTKDDIDLAHARSVLDEDHYGLDKIKERILEFLAVRGFKSDARTPILCFVGPPGTGKTSLGRSIARALGRKFARQSLGGVHDEAEIRGHRRTYMGAMPGKLIQAIRRAESNNPVIMLDEIDKLGRDFRGDPSSALLEVLDPEQNRTFVDHYLNLPFDLSKTLFVCTANYLDPVPAPLRDRMEIIELSGYTEHEKLEIARRHLMPKILAEHGVESLGLQIADDGIVKIIRSYTRDAGVRSLERRLAATIRKTTKELAEKKDPARIIDADRVRELLGPERFLADDVPKIDEPGGALGLAWTPAGGEVLVIEAASMPGNKGFVLTGQLGDVMKESARAALSYVRSNAGLLGIDPRFFADNEIHLHVPAGAIPKDGPSAGTAMCTALMSLFTRRLPRAKTAMTGEITLRGRVLPVGGIKEKVLGAHRAGLTTVLIPRENVKDLEDIPPEVRDELTIHPVVHMDEVARIVLDLVVDRPAPREPTESHEEVELRASSPEHH